MNNAQRGRRWGRHHAGAAVVLLAVAGCEVGPAFRPPEVPPVATLADSAAMGAMIKDSTLPQVIAGGAVPARWWDAFGSPDLNDLVARVAARNQTLAAAQADLAQAREILAQARGGYFPSVDASANAERRPSLYSLGASVSYPLDLFGGTRRKVEEEAALVEDAHYQLAAAYLTVTGNAVTQAITIASLRQQLQAVNQILADDQTNLDLVQAKFQAGKVAQSDVLTAQSQLDADRALVPPLDQQLAVARHALSVLAGQYPSQWDPPALDLDHLKLADTVPLSVPSDLVHQRPDILAAEAQLHASSAAIGVAQAQLYPNIILSGSLATEASSTTGLFRGPSVLWNLLGGLTAPLFHGALKAGKRAAVDAHQAAFATYRQTVLSAFQQVADVLNALAADAQLVQAEDQAVRSSRASLDLQRVSYDAGKSNLLQLIDAERSYEQARLGDGRAVAQRYQDVAQLAVGMGGGWWQIPESARLNWGQS